MMWTQSSIHSALHVLKVLVEASLWFSIVSVRWELCPRLCLFVTEQIDRSVLLTHTFDLTWCWGEKLPPDCLYVFLQAVCACYMVACELFYASVGCRIPFYVLAFYTRDVSWMDTFERNASHPIPASRWRLFICWAWWCCVLLFFNGVDCSVFQ